MAVARSEPEKKPLRWDLIAQGALIAILSGFALGAGNAWLEVRTLLESHQLFTAHDGASLERDIALLKQSTEDYQSHAREERARLMTQLQSYERRIQRLENVIGPHTSRRYDPPR